MNDASYQQMEKLLQKYCDLSAPLRVLDVGSRDVNGSYRRLMPKTWTYSGCDIQPGRNVDILMPALYDIPLPGGSCGLVISGQCLEHVPNPFRLMRDMARVLAPGGLMIVSAPWRFNIHRYPLDCWRVCPDGMAELFRDSGLAVVRIFRLGDFTWGIASKPPGPEAP